MNEKRKEELLKRIVSKIDDERMFSLFELLVEHEDEQNEDERTNIRRTIAEILENAPLELP